MTEPRDPADAITVVLADDQGMVRSGLRVILEAERDIAVVGEAGDGREAVELVRRSRPAVALLDIRMPVMDGLRAAREVLTVSPRTRVLILTTFDADEYVYEALRAGASGFLLKDAPADQLVLGGARTGRRRRPDRPRDHATLDRPFRRSGAAPVGSARAPWRSSPASELDVLRLLARGLSNVEIAGRLVIEENTVKTHVSRILAKLRLRDRVQAVVLAYETGFVVPEPDG